MVITGIPAALSPTSTLDTLRICSNAPWAECLVVVTVKVGADPFSWALVSVVEYVYAPGVRLREFLVVVAERRLASSGDDASLAGLSQWGGDAALDALAVVGARVQILVTEVWAP
jgi:hypothetical protein